MMKPCGAVDLTLPRGGRLRSQIVGLCYYQPVSEEPGASGASVLIAELKSSVGEVVSSGTVIYRDAFEGITADVTYEYTGSSFEQDVVIRRRLPPPEAFGLSSDSAHLAVLTEFVEHVQPRRTPRRIDVRAQWQAAGLNGPDTLEDVTLYFGSMRLAEGRAFSLGNESESIPVGKSWVELEAGRWFLVESTPYAFLKAQLETLSAGLTPNRRAPAGEFKSLLRQLQARAPVSPEGGQIKLALAAVDSEPGVVLDYLLVTTPLLNVDFVYAGKSGCAAAGQSGGDYWNTYDCPDCDWGALSDLDWSDGSPSTVGIVVSNAPGVGFNPYCLDPMYQYFIHSTGSVHATVTITNLPADVYDVFVYAARASDVAGPLIELKRDTTSLWKKGTTRWGDGWYANPWEENEQYVRFRDIAVTNQSLTLDSYPDAAGYASLSGLQIIPSSALPDETPEINQLLNVNFGAYDTNKVGFAAVGLTANDFWTGVPQAYNNAISVKDLKWSDQSVSAVGLLLLNAPGNWGTQLFDPMLKCYKYAQSGGNATLILTNLPAGKCNVYLYGHAATLDDNAIFELWSGGVRQGVKGTSLYGYGFTSNRWENGQQYVLFADVTVSSNEPVVIHAKHSGYGYDNLSGLQIAYTGEADTDEDGLPDGWEMKWLGSLDWTASGDPDSDGLDNLKEYQRSLDPLRADSDGDGIGDAWDYATPWLEDAAPQGSALYGSSESWSWVESWSGGGWGGATVYPFSGSKMHISAYVANNSHQHYFERAVEVTRPGTGDVLYAYINLDSTYPPAEVMLQFRVLESNGSYSWEHRAYWGANNIAWGVNGTASRRYVGPLPGAGQWVRLAVPASELNLEGRIIEGMAFTLWGGRAAWDSAGRLTPIGTDRDGNGVLDYLEDANCNGIPDSIEALAGFDPNVPNQLGETQPGYELFLGEPKPTSQIP